MERIRDFLYDISDLLISLLIIAAIFTVISWKLNESIPIEASMSPPATEEPAAADTPPAVEEEPTEPENTAPATDPESDPADPVTDASDADKPIGGVTTQEPADTPATPPAAGKTITIDIPSGSPGVAIGNILKEKGLITDVSAFIQKVDALGLGPKLRSGSFQLKTGMDLEQIIKVLANVN